MGFCSCFGRRKLVDALPWPVTSALAHSFSVQALFLLAIHNIWEHSEGANIINRLNDLDAQLAQRYGAFASYSSNVGPALVETFGDGPTDEVDRLLNIFATSRSHVLDLGCGAGFTICRLARQVASIWGLEQDENLLEAARLRAAEQKARNVMFVSGNVANPMDVKKLPDNTFDLVLSRRGPSVNEEVMEKLKPEAFVIQELFQDSLGLLESFGRKTHFADIGDNPYWQVEEYSWVGLFPVSVKDYYYELYFRDIKHLASYLSQEKLLFSWPMPPMPYREERDRDALELYTKYNTTPKGIRIIDNRKVYLFRRERVHYAPAAPEVEPIS